MMKEDLVGRKLPYGLFGANAACWRIMLLIYNLNSATKRLVLSHNGVTLKLMVIRFTITNLLGRVVIWWPLNY